MIHPRVAVFDLDGTLAESKQRVSADVGEALAALLKKIPVAVMSGGRWSQFESQFFPALPIDTPLEKLFLFPTNAAQCFVYRAGSWKLHYDHSFSESERTQIEAVLKECLAAAHLPAEPGEWGLRIEYRSPGQISYSPLGQHAPVAAKEEWHKAHDEERRALRNSLLARLPECTISLGGITTIDITPKGINKNHGILKLAELTGATPAQMLYVGDALEPEGNDAVVKESGIQTQQVFGPEETLKIIQSLL